MKSTFTISINAKELERDLTALQRTVIPQAASAAINKTLTHAKTLAVRQVAKAAGIKQAHVRPSFKVDRATPVTQAGMLTASGKHIKLSYFPSRQLKKGVKVKVWGKWQLYPGTFMAKMKTGHIGIFRKTGEPHPRRRWRRTKTGRRKANQSAMVRPARPIKELWGPSVPVEFDRAIHAGLDKAIQEKLKANYVGQLNWRISRLKEGR